MFSIYKNFGSKPLNLPIQQESLLNQQKHSFNKINLTFPHQYFTTFPNLGNAKLKFDNSLNNNSIYKNLSQKEFHTESEGSTVKKSVFDEDLLLLIGLAALFVIGLTQGSSPLMGFDIRAENTDFSDEIKEKARYIENQYPLSLSDFLHEESPVLFCLIHSSRERNYLIDRSYSHKKISEQLIQIASDALNNKGLTSSQKRAVTVLMRDSFAKHSRANMNSLDLLKEWIELIAKEKSGSALEEIIQYGLLSSFCARQKDENIKANPEFFIETLPLLVKDRQNVPVPIKEAIKEKNGSHIELC